MTRKKKPIAPWTLYWFWKNLDTDVMQMIWDEAFRYVEQMLCSRVSLLEEQLLTLPAEEASVILMWVLGYHQFEKLGADRRNAERELYSL